MTGTPVALVTGASTGIGKAVAERLAHDGLRVFGTSRDPSRAPAPPGVEMLPLDVDRTDSAAACVEAVLRSAGRLDVLVNNAGFLLVGAIEEISLDEARRQFETNVFGVLRMSKAVLPHMRARGAGRIINIGSLSATVAIPFGGMYTATKRALQGITESMRHEVRPFGVEVSLVEATFIATDAADVAHRPGEAMAIYDRARETAHEAWRREIARGSRVDVVAGRVSNIVRARHTRFRYPAGFEAWWMPLARPLAPSWLVERLTRKRFDLGE